MPRRGEEVGIKDTHTKITVGTMRGTASCPEIRERRTAWAWSKPATKTEGLRKLVQDGPIARSRLLIKGAGRLQAESRVAAADHVLGKAHLDQVANVSLECLGVCLGRSMQSRETTPS